MFWKHFQTAQQTKTIDITPNRSSKLTKKKQVISIRFKSFFSSQEIHFIHILLLSSFLLIEFYLTFTFLSANSATILPEIRTASSDPGEY
ncbi:MAG: hypothetical protein BGN96_13140 [Bacteroidales bacterium 45-6]|nr:MAG: hypothetical protein BGN96_13140 [Bacteroidales bacterium 45-6]